MWTKAQISIFKPTGFEDTYVMETDDRGLTARCAMDHYPGGEMKFVNSVVVNYISDEEAHRLIDAKRARLIPGQEGK